MTPFSLNPYRQSHPQWDPNDRAAFECEDILQVHRSLPEYEPTPLISLPVLGDQLGVGQILVKDESHRFGLKAFKALGATYAIYRYLKRDIEARGGSLPDASEFYRTPDIIQPGSYTFCTATDGNHGRGVAWAARKLNQRAVIYMPENTVPARIENIRLENAEVIIVDGNYDKAVGRCAADAEKHGWQIISDTSWPGYEQIPRWIMAGYTTMFREIHEMSGKPVDVDVVFVQAGVGSLAAAVAWYYNKAYTKRTTKLVSVEPTDADCLLESIRAQGGNPTQSLGKQDSIMAGLNCGTPSLAAWPLIKTGFDFFIAIPDDYSLAAMRRYYYPQGNDQQIISGESGAAGLAALNALCENDSLAAARESLGLTSNSTILLLNTEGDTDSVNFERVVKSRS
jgi:diaminopropionate ammonia-lyase